MNQLLSAEALKLRSTRSFYAMNVGALALIAATVSATAALSTFHAGDHPGRDTLSPAGFALTAALILGVLSVTSEFRYGTITPALLIAPKRVSLVAAKAINLARVGLVLGLLAFASASALVLLVLSSRGLSSQLDAGDLAGIIAGGTIATALFAVLGVGVGTIVRNQVGAIVAALGLLYAVEPPLTFIPGIGDAVQTFGLGGLASAACATTAFKKNADLLDQVPAILVLTGYALAALFTGASRLRRRDIAG
jgi:ABC-2 type transport system permease protein